MKPAEVSWESVMDYVSTFLRGKDAASTDSQETRSPGAIAPATRVRACADRHCRACTGCAAGHPRARHHGGVARRSGLGATLPGTCGRPVHPRVDHVGFGWFAYPGVGGACCFCVLGLQGPPCPPP